ncbi:hypothetical protein AB6A40_004198 [Gnathostoma spinigerum]|uniref:B30.2/SPRY domain-containing protein n=1 Tax=Gnathostoma spinigerum TaxID=75299 RepID=A0ABD6EBS5_9BILA
MRPKGSRREIHKPVSSSVCYCDGKRELGTLELFCASCRKWFHQRCLKDLTEFYGLSFMVCYVFNCSDCSPTKKETWSPRQANFAHMCVTVLSNLTFERMKEMKEYEPTIMDHPLQKPIYFDFEKEIIPYFDKQWENLTSMTRRVKNTWHGTLMKALAKETDLFESNSTGEMFALRERNLLAIGPVHEGLRKIGKNKNASSGSLRDAIRESGEKVEDSDGPKTRGSSKRKNVDGNMNAVKKVKFTPDYSSTRIAGIASPIDFPFNREGYRYYLVEKDMNVPNRELFEQEDTVSGKPIPAHIYRVVTHPSVTLSPNDRAYQLKLSEDRLSVSGIDGYCVARATHSVCHGTWYFEVSFSSRPPESAARVGWSQALAPVQACVGYTVFSYAWRSVKGTKFHDARGKHYAETGYDLGDTVGCMISLPPSPADCDYDFASASQIPASSSYLPPSRKDLPLINFKHHYFYEEKDEVEETMRNLKPIKGSYIEYFKNGVSCGIAYQDVYEGFYFPAVSLFQGATMTCNFGPEFKYRKPPKARSMSERVEELHVEQTVADILYLVENSDKLAKEAANYMN